MRAVKLQLARSGVECASPSNPATALTFDIGIWTDRSRIAPRTRLASSSTTSYAPKLTMYAALFRCGQLSCEGAPLRQLSSAVASVSLSQM
jgi:hypothetical protein